MAATPEEHLNPQVPISGQSASAGETIPVSRLPPPKDCVEPSREPCRQPERIGPYRILGVLGEGGMGVVYAAEQKEPIHRRVALKVIKQGMDTREVVARFEAERQALALLNHPGIAKIYDAGATVDGRPYFVMEHVDGLPLIEYCDRHKLGLRARLGLFLQVCHGVEHAHHRGIIHRDLKPSNILVTTPDEGPVAKIIDFGVAKATNQRLTEKTVYTEVGRVIGTPAYMSPEQAERTSEDVDHRSDVYSLGVILYELLVGELPLSLDVQKIAFDELIRRIRDDDPPTPSARWTQLNIERTTDLATRRRTSPAALRGELRGDLDWITMRAMEKERERRYGSASNLADDIDRFLKKEPVLAGPPSAIYRIRKYVRRHRTMVVSISSVILALTLGLLASIWFAVEARNSREEAVASEESAQKNEATAKARLEEVLRLSDIEDLKNYTNEAGKLWSASPPKVEAVEAWLEKARALVKRLPEQRLTLENLRAKALPYSNEAAKNDRESHPKASELVGLVESRKKAQDEIAKLEGSGSKGGSATVLSYGKDEKKKHTTYYFRYAFDAEGPEKLTALRFSIFSDDGVVVYLNGQEALRENMPEGPIGYTSLAVNELSDAEHIWRHEKMFAEVGGGLIQGRNLLAVELHLASRRSPDLRFDLEVLGLPREGDVVTLVKRGSPWGYYDRGEDLGEAWRAPAYNDSSWKVGTGPFGYGFAGGPGKLLELKQAKEKLSEMISGLEKEVSARRTWEFAETRDRWWHDALQGLIKDLEAFASSTLPIVEKRFEIVRRSIGKWDEAIATIRNEKECPRYGGLSIKPQEGLVPLGRDPQSGLWEFAHIETGEVPKRGGDGKLILTEETGIVFVLVPGGTFRMGAVKPDEKNPIGSPNVDPDTQSEHGPVHEVNLAPFFLSKYEMTQGQWLRITGDNPSYFTTKKNLGGKQISLLYPVEQVSWFDCREVIERLGLLLPTEAQWEYAARADTTTVWWTGNEEKTVEGAANLKNAIPTPIGSFKANAFGLHDVMGNMWEWCRDWVGSYEIPVKAGDGERQVPMEGARYRVVRGGGSYCNFSVARSSFRYQFDHRNCSTYIGVRPARVITP